MACCQPANAPRRLLTVATTCGGQDGEKDELAVAPGAEMVAHPGYLLHAQGALGGAAQVRGQAAVALQQDRSRSRVLIERYHAHRRRSGAQ